MNASRAVLAVAVVVLILGVIRTALSAPPSPPPTGSVYPLAYSSGAPTSLVANGDGALNVDGSTGTLFPGPGTIPATPAPSTCYHVSGAPSEVISVIFVDYNQLGSGNSVDLFDETNTGTCADANRIYSSGNAGAGAIITLNLPLQHGLNFEVVGTPTFVTGYGIRFKVAP